jgi:hypothetical protein
MEREKIIFLRNFFLRAFVVGILFALFYFIAILALWNTYGPWLAQWFKLDEKELGAVTLNFFANLRIVIVLFFLVPALALHWSAKNSNLLHLRKGSTAPGLTS